MHYLQNFSFASSITLVNYFIYLTLKIPKDSVWYLSISPSVKRAKQPILNLRSRPKALWNQNFPPMSHLQGSPSSLWRPWTFLGRPKLLFENSSDSNCLLFPFALSTLEYCACLPSAQFPFCPKGPPRSSNPQAQDCSWARAEVHLRLWQCALNKLRDDVVDCLWCYILYWFGDSFGMSNTTLWSSSFWGCSIQQCWNPSLSSHKNCILSLSYGIYIICVFSL